MQFWGRRKKISTFIHNIMKTTEYSVKSLNTGTTNETFQQSGKQDSFRHLLKSSVSMNESSGP